MVAKEKNEKFVLRGKILEGFTKKVFSAKP